MSKIGLKLKLGALAAAGLLALGAVAAPVVVTKGSNAGYLYFPGSSGPNNGDPTGGNGGVTIDAMQLAATQCYTSSGVVTLPVGFTKGYIQAILVAGGEGGSAGSATTLTHADIGTITATPGAGSAGGDVGHPDLTSYRGGGGGGGGYMGNGGAGGANANSEPGGQGGGASGGGGSGFGFGGTPGAGANGAGNKGQGITITTPAAIPCPGVSVSGGSSDPGSGGAQPGSGFGAGGAGVGGSYMSARGGNAGGIATIIWKYTGGPITLSIGTGGAKSGWRGNGADGAVMLRFIPL